MFTVDVKQHNNNNDNIQISKHQLLASHSNVLGGGRVVRWSLIKLPVPGHPTVWMIVGLGPIALAVGTGGGCLDIFTLLYPFPPLSPSLWETARYKLKYGLKGPLNPKQPTNQQAFHEETKQAHPFTQF